MAPGVVRFRALARPAVHRLARAEAAWPLVVLAALCAGTSALVLSLGADTTFFRDEWAFVAYRDGGSAENYLAPHAGHLSVVPVAVYVGLFDLVGLGSSLPFRLVLLVLHLAVVVLAFVWSARRVGRWPAVGLAALVALFGPGAIDILWPFQLGSVAAVGAGVGMLLALDADRRPAAAALLALSLASAAVGLAFAVAAIVDWALRGDRLRRAWVWAVPVALWAVWLLDLGWEQSQFRADNLRLAPGFAFDMAAAAAGALTGFGPRVGVLVLGVTAYVVGRRLLVDRLSRPAIVVVTAGAAFWLLTGLEEAHGDDPEAGRHLYPGAVILLLLFAELARGSVALPRRAAVVAILLGGLAIASNTAALIDGADDIRDRSAETRAALGALEIARDRVDPNLTVEPETTLSAQIPAGHYFDATRRWSSSPALGEAQLARASEAARERADRVLVRALRLAAVPGPVGPTAATDPLRVSGGTVSLEGDCVRLRPGSGEASLDLAMTAAGVAIDPQPESTATLRLRRFGARFATEPVLAPLDAMSRLRIPADRSSRPWTLRVSSPRPVRVCRLAA